MRVAFTLIVSALLAMEAAAAAGRCGDAGERPPISRAPRVLEPSTIVQIQRELSKRGYYEGAIDGLWGPQTERAFRRFQEARGFERVGRLTLRSLASLGIREAEAGLAACRRE